MSGPRRPRGHGTRVVPPFVIDEGDGTYSGLTIQLWERLNRRYLGGEG